MNRRQRKQMEKQLGITKLKQKMTNKERFEAIRENIIAGKQMEAEMRETRRRQEENQQDKNASSRISSIATDLMINKGMDYVAAQAEAKEQYKREVESTDNTER